MSDYPDQTRNLHPTPEAVLAMWWWGREYSEQRGGSMDFWDHLSVRRKSLCLDAIVRIKQAINEQGIESDDTGNSPLPINIERVEGGDGKPSICHLSCPRAQHKYDYQFPSERSGTNILILSDNRDLYCLPEAPVRRSDGRGSWPHRRRIEEGI